MVRMDKSPHIRDVMSLVHPMSYSTQVTYNRTLVRRALNRFMVNRMGWALIVGTSVMFLFLVVLFLMRIWGFWLSLVSCALIIAVGGITYIYFLRLRTSEGFFDKVQDPTVTFTFDQDGVRTDSQLGTSELKWAAFDELLKFPDVWLLIYARSGYMTLPTNALTLECQAFIEEKLASSNKGT